MRATVLKTQATYHRDQMRALAERSPSAQLKREKAQRLFSAVANGAYHEFDVGPWTNAPNAPASAQLRVQGSRGEWYRVHLLSDGYLSCTCADAKRGNVCKHQQLLVAYVLDRCRAEAGKAHTIPLSFEFMFERVSPGRYVVRWAPNEKERAPVNSEAREQVGIVQKENDPQMGTTWTGLGVPRTTRVGMARHMRDAYTSF